VTPVTRFGTPGCTISPGSTRLQWPNAHARHNLAARMPNSETGSSGKCRLPP
jgi:hypothetical protein